MKKTTTFPAILTLAAVLGFVLVSVEQAEPAGPFKANPIWQITVDGTATPVNWADADNPRFAIYDPDTPEDETDDAVLDKETGLVWERSPDTMPSHWLFAKDYCHRSELANRKGLRLPTIEELASLVDEGGGSPVLPAGHPFINVQSAGYWSSTTYAGYTPAAWAVHFNDGYVGASDKSTMTFYMWCVRGGQGHDAY